MKTERKHELQTNVLADWLGVHVERARPYLKNVLIGLGILVVAGIVFLIVQQQKAQETAAGWRDYFLASFAPTEADRAGKLERVADLHPTDVSGLWAGLNWAEIKLKDGCDRLFSDRELARKDLKEARAKFVEVEAQAPADSDLAKFAIFGLAQTLEAEGDTKAAIDKFSKLAAMAPESAFGKTAKARVEFLVNNSIGDFYDWFSKQTPRVQPPFGNRDLLPPDFGDMLDRPEKSKPDLGRPFGGFGSEIDSETPPASDEPKPEDGSKSEIEPTPNAESSKSSESSNDPPGAP